MNQKQVKYVIADNGPAKAIAAKAAPVIETAKSAGCRTANPQLTQ